MTDQPLYLKSTVKRQLMVAGVVLCVLDGVQMSWICMLIHHF